MDKQQFHEQLTKTSKVLLRERERENNARGVFDFLKNFLIKHYFNGAF